MLGKLCALLYFVFQPPTWSQFCDHNHPTLLGNGAPHSKVWKRNCSALVDRPRFRNSGLFSPLSCSALDVRVAGLAKRWSCICCILCFASTRVEARCYADNNYINSDYHGWMNNKLYMLCPAASIYCSALFSGQQTWRPMRWSSPLCSFILAF